MVTETKPNAELAYRVLAQIDGDPKSWNQGTWDCGTAACFAGWAVRLSGGTSEGALVVAGPVELVGMSVEEAAQEVLGLTEDACWVELKDGKEGGWLFGPDITRDDLGSMVAEIFGPRPDGDPQ